MSTVLTRDQPLLQRRIVTDVTGKDEPATSTTSSTDDLTLGVPLHSKKFFWQKSKTYDPDAIATLPSVFDDPDTAEKYHPRSDWENYHRFDTSARWTWAEEQRLVRKIDLRIMIFAIIMFMALEIDRSNLSQALTDNFLKDLHISTDGEKSFITSTPYLSTRNVFKLAFLCSELPSQLVSKWMGPDRWIPTQLTIWSIVAASQFWLSGKESFIACRALLGLLQGGFIPDIILYLSYFYKHHELSIRLGYFWTGMSIADIISALLAYGLLHMRGVAGLAGWRWLFMIEGILTFIIGLLAYLLMPAGPCHTASWFRGKNGWFTEREQTIIVNRVIRDDPSKSDMHNREPVTPKLLWKSLKDFDLCGTFQVNLLTIPYYVGHSQIWALPLLVAMVTLNLATINKWVLYGILVILLSYPNVCCMNFALYLLTKAYYVFRNKQRDKKWNALSEDERLEYLSTTTDEGNKRLDFRFQH
ncbi:hypothetical protein VM1G_10505 [Cytospora mali]|uniref:Major facilitator superfamily (MFS) profile domain-containing protein n=1 Tax=Cytospora mali TaxID=578113 RepID=A0A194VIB7_CYTMA|nr:hypothetical protein VM1G_10505 [Valsa mali]